MIIPTFTDPETVRRQNGALRSLNAALEAEIEIHRNKAGEYHQAVLALDSEREANAILTDEVERLRSGLETLVSHLDGCKRIERGAGGMTIDAQIRRTDLVGVKAIWVEEARDTLFPAEPMIDVALAQGRERS